ncbi:MAG: hypothetical protein COA42_15245 [Alteromonadaceae bacterium]|nr:MAG: hypothetical protein COA42_15245 [Alteromonadaceae bacterium]
MSAVENHVIVDITVSQEEIIKLYEGVKNASVVARDGRRIQFPANILRPFVTVSGVHGSFVIYFDQDMKYQGIDRLG